MLPHLHLGLGDPTSKPFYLDKRFWGRVPGVGSQIDLHNYLDIFYPEGTTLADPRDGGSHPGATQKNSPPDDAPPRNITA